LKAVVAPTDSGGSVAFYADGSSTPLANCGAQALTMTSGATCSTSSLLIGTHALSATYSGDASYAGSSGATSVTVTHTAEEEAKAKAEAEAKKKAEEEATRKKVEEEARKKSEAEAVAKRKAEEEVAAKKKQEEEQAKKSSTKPPTRAQLLAKALKACKKQPKKKRGQCDAAARKKYGAKGKKGKVRK
jgi:flagellar biosynthesis GTPase FlhF